MKYLVGFGSKEKRKKDVKEFCETYLAYLTDEYIRSIYVEGPRLLQASKYSLYYVEIHFENDVFWSQIRDHFITFLEMVKKTYVFRETIDLKMCSICWKVEDTRLGMSYNYTFEEIKKEEIEKFPFDINLGILDGRVISIKLEILEDLSNLV